MSQPVIYRRLDAGSFPFTIEALDSRDGSIVWSCVVTGPGAIDIPPLAKRIGAPVHTRIVWPDGEIGAIP